MVQCVCGAELDPAAAGGHGGRCGGCGARVHIVGDAESVTGAFVQQALGTSERTAYLLGGGNPVGIGRRVHNQIVLQGVGVSREHCIIARAGDRWQVQDLGSANGTLVNGRRIDKHTLADGDVLQVDENKLTYQPINPGDTYDLGQHHDVPPLESQAHPPSEIPRGGSDPEPLDDNDVFELDTDPQPPATDAAPAHVTEADKADDTDDDGLFELDDAPEHILRGGGVPERDLPGDNTAGAPPAPDGPAPVCPGCGKQLSPGAKICVDCGLDVKTGRSIVVSRGVDENRIYHNAEQIIRVISWLVPPGFYPVASEAPGDIKPWTTRVIAVLTILVSVWYWWLSGEQMGWGKDLMLWAGGQPPTAEQIEEYYYWGDDWGDIEAFEAARERLRVAAQQEAQGASDPSAPPKTFKELIDLHVRIDTADRYDKIIIAAHESLTPRQRAIGEYAWYQLLTHALLHADIFHLLGNLYFLMIFGTRVNALIGNTATALLYPLLAVLAGVAHTVSAADSLPIPMLGASGAVMGMAGMYLVLFPANRVHVAAWFRRWWYLAMNIWPVRGFWVVLFYIVFDVVYVAIGVETGVAHWAHLGGFAAGAIIVVVLLVLRVLNTGGGDVVSLMLGKRAWALVGKPADQSDAGLRLPPWLKPGG